MSTVAEVRLWGRTIGAVSIGEGEAAAAFEYSPDFTGSGIEPAPLAMPLSSRVYRFPALNPESFHGLPGLLADSLPDRFGNALINTWLARQGRSPESFNAVERLCYTGSRGMGALEFYPVSGPEVKASEKLEVEELVSLASEILSRREQIHVSIGENSREEALRLILQVGTSAGGARAKAVISWNKDTGEVRSGQTKAPEGFEHWILKFDGISSNRDKELNDPMGYCAVEYAYSLMAGAAGIRMSRCRLLEENGRRHFMTRRFDRIEGGRKLHMQTLGALSHLDYNQAGAAGYEQVFQVIRQLGLTLEAVEEMYRRMVFNVLARNQDDHVKNIAFLMDKRGQWTLAPAYDLTYSYQPSGMWTGSHQMTLNGKRDNFSQDDFKDAAAAAGMKRGRWKAILSEVYESVAKWRNWAVEAQVPEAQRELIQANLRLFLKP